MARTASTVTWSRPPGPMPMTRSVRVTPAPCSRTVLQVALDVEVDLLHRGDDLRVGLGPQPPVGRLAEPLDDAAQRPRVRLLHERLIVLVEDVLLGQGLVHPVVDDAGGRVEAEQVVDRGGQLERAL